MTMKPLTPLRRAGAALALTLALASPGIAHAAFPGENGVIVYSVDGSLWKVAGDGTQTAVPTPQFVTNPAVSPNGKRVAFMSRSGVDAQSLRVMNLDGSQTVAIDQLRFLDVFSAPAWSPDGRTLTLMDMFGNVLLYDVATLSKRTLVDRLSEKGPSARLSWSPLGDTIAGDAQPESWRVDVASARVSTIPALAYPDWLPDGSGALVGVSTAGDASFGCLVRTNPDGSGRQVFPDCSQAYPTVSPDGSALLASNAAGNAGFRISVRNFQGQTLREVAPRADKRVDWSRVPKTAMRTTLGQPGEWAVPTPLAGDSDTYTSQSAIAVMPDNGARGGALRRALGIGTDGRVYERALLVNGNWGVWALVPGRGQAAGGMAAKQVAIAGALDGSLQAVIVGSDDIVYHAMRYANGSWSGFNPVTGAGGAPNFAARDVAIAIVNSSGSTPGEAHVAANGLAAGEAYHRVRLKDGSWTPWGALGGPATNALAVAFAGNKDLYLVGTTTAGGIARTVRHASGAWAGWVNASDVPPGGVKDVSVAIDSDAATGIAKLAYLAYVRSDNQVWSQARPSPLSNSSWTTAPQWSSLVMPDGRSVSMAIGGGTLELLVVQAQPQ